MSEMHKLAKDFVGVMTSRMREETNFQMRKTYLGYIVDTNGPILMVNNQKLPRNAYRIAKSVSLKNVRVNDEVLVVQSDQETLILTAVMRTDDDAGDDMHIDGDVVITGDTIVKKSLEASGGLILKRVDGPVSDASFDVVPPTGTMALDVTNLKLYIKFGTTWHSVNF